MNYTKTTTNLQQNIDGSEKVITSFVFSGVQSGPSVYLQGNLHGSEIIGSVLLTKLIEYLSSLDDIAGKLTIVPTANPIGSSIQVYGYQVGRWNMQNGKNWNRIFKKNSNPDNSIESKLARLLLNLASESDIILDIHASGKVNVPHIYTYEACAELYKPLGAMCEILFPEAESAGAFDEACFLLAKERGKIISVATWEAGTHGNLSAEETEARSNQLLSFLSSIGVLQNIEPEPSVSPVKFPLGNVKALCSPQAGYVVWKVAPGAKLVSGEVYAKLYQPWNGSTIELKAESDMYLIAQFALQAVASGQEIGKVGF